MTRIPSGLMAIIAVVLAVLGGRTDSVQDKYTLMVPNGLAFSEFGGYEDWQVVAARCLDSGRIARPRIRGPVRPGAELTGEG